MSYVSVLMFDKSLGTRLRYQCIIFVCFLFACVRFLDRLMRRAEMWKRDIYHVAFIEAPYSVVASPHLASLLSPLSSLALPLLPLSPPSPGVMAAGLKYTITYQHQHLS